MPYKRVWEPNPSDMNLLVHKETPKGFLPDSGWSGYQVARLPVKVLLEQKAAGQPIDHRSFYQCKHCEGWIEGDPYEYQESSLGNRCGRRGIAASCRRCGKEIGFSGLMS